MKAGGKKVPGEEKVLGTILPSTAMMSRQELEATDVIIVPLR